MPPKRLTRVAAGLRTAATSALDLLLPRVCLLCDDLLGAQPEMVCIPCWNKLQPLPHPRCARCGHPTNARACRWCELLDPRIAAVRSVCWVPEGTGGEVVHKLKYGGWTGVGTDIAARIVRQGRTWTDDEHVVLVPVPLGDGRFRERGFNQCAIIAAALGQRWNVPVAANALVRVRETKSQVVLTPEERSVNVHGAFAAGTAADVARGAHIVLVDDVVTTGATLNACAAAIFAAGASTVSYITFGRARAAFDRTATPGA
jgi:ComF family protein